MSLKTIHVVFITASLLMTAFFGIWAFREYRGPEGLPMHLAFGIVSVLGFAGLLAYGKYFLNKLKHISYL